MDPEGYHDDDVFGWDDNANATNLGLDFFSQPPSFPTAASSSTGHGGFPRRGSGGVEGLDLNSQAVDNTDNMSCMELLRASPAILGEGERGGARRGAVRAAGRGTGRGACGGRGTGRAAVTSTSMLADHDRAVRSQPVVSARRLGRGAGHGAGRGAVGRPPAPSVPRQVRAPRPVEGGRKSTGSIPIAGDIGYDSGLPQTDASTWSQNPFDDEANDVVEHDASMNSSSSDEEDDSEENSSSSGEDETRRIALNQLDLVQQFGAVACMIGMYHESTFMNKAKKLKTGLSGHEWVLRTLDNQTACYNMFRMSRELFFRLHDELVSKYGLTSSSKMSSVESLALFLWIVGAPQSVRQAENRFERSTETVSRKFHEVLDCVFRLSADIIKPTDPQFRTVHPRLQSPRFSPHFDNCIGAIDGTHIPVVVPASKLPQHVGRYGYSTQNVLAICDFDMRFTFAVAGWPGSVHDMRVFNDAITKYGDKFPHPPQGKFYLVDSGYPNRPGYLAPYKGTKYHLAEFRQGPRPRGKKELFNYLHSSLRNVIERSFGVLKMKWRILLDLPSYPMPKQSKIILACMALHNFIRESAMRDEDFDRCDEDEDYMPLPVDVASQQIGVNNHLGDEDVDMNAFRDSIANALYGDGE